MICTILIGIGSTCDFCPRETFRSVCIGEIVCRTQTDNALVQCYVQKIISTENIGQLLIQGPCGSILNYVHFCLDNNIR